MLIKCIKICRCDIKKYKHNMDIIVVGVGFVEFGWLVDSVNVSR